MRYEDRVRQRFIVVTATQAPPKTPRNRIIDTSYPPGDPRGRGASFSSRREAETRAWELNKAASEEVTENPSDSERPRRAWIQRFLYP